MRKSSFQKNHDEFEDTLDWYGDFIARIVGAQRVIRYKYEKTEVLEALVLRIASLWDVLVEDDLVDALNKDASRYGHELGLKLRKHLSRDECEAIFVGHGYLDFRSVGEAQKFAKRFLVDKHNPFKLIPRDAARLINQFFVIRNYLSHYSSRSRRAYEQMLRSEYGLQRIAEPGVFFLARNRRTRNLRLVDYLNAFEKASQEMRRIGT
jgi:hypothetical protein